MTKEYVNKIRITEEQIKELEPDYEIMWGTLRTKPDGNRYYTIGECNIDSINEEKGTYGLEMMYLVEAHGVVWGDKTKIIEDERFDDSRNILIVTEAELMQTTVKHNYSEEYDNMVSFYTTYTDSDAIIEELDKILRCSLRESK